jgi:hypothetical protein
MVLSIIGVLKWLSVRAFPRCEVDGMLVMSLPLKRGCAMIKIGAMN